MKILYVTTIGSTMAFFKSFIKSRLDMGDSVDIACNTRLADVPACYREWGLRVFDISCTRSPLGAGNLKAVSELKKLAARGGYDIVHCHTPIAAFCTRLACRSERKKRGLKVFYTAHGFHFYKGAPLKNWQIYYPAEKLCAGMTDVLVTINKEDYSLARADFKNTKVVYVPGVGIDTAFFKNAEADRAKTRAELGIPENAYMLLSVGELNENKNHAAVIRAVAASEKCDFYYAVAGEGPLHEELSSLAKELGVSGRVKLLGYRSDCEKLYKTADLYIHPSFREGLPVAPMEAMASGLYTIVSDIRGCEDLVSDKPLRFDPGDVSAIKNLIEALAAQPKITPDFDAQKYDRAEINRIMSGLYEESVKP